jgi:hypothetical protein
VSYRWLTVIMSAAATVVFLSAIIGGASYATVMTVFTVSMIVIAIVELVHWRRNRR